MDNIEAIYELAPIQEGMLFHTLLAPGAGFYFEQFHCILRGKLDLELFAKVWQRIVARHGALRTSFLWHELGQPMQRVHRRVDLALEVKDWRSLSPVSQAKQLEAYLESDRQRGFRLEEPPLMRLCLFRVADAVFHFVWTFHHSLLDGWSYLIVLKELFSLYESCAQNAEIELKPARPYQDYIASRRQLNLDQARKFWRETLKGFHASTSISLSSANLESDASETGFGEQKTRFASDLTEALRSFARQYRLTLSTLIQGAWAILLHRYTSEDDIVYGTTVCGRPPELEGVESMIGVFINTLPVRSDVSGNPAVLRWLKDLQERLIDFQCYEYTPLAVIRNCSELPPDQPLFESIVIFENVPADASLWERGRNIKIQNVRFLSRTHYPLTLAAHADTEMTLSISYHRARFEDGAIRRMFGHLRSLLHSMMGNPAQRIRDLSLLAAEERQQLLVEWNPPGTRRLRESLVHELFEAQVEKTPEAVAVICRNQRLTYHQLNEQANWLAQQLQALGVGPEVLVGLCLEPSEALLVGLLGILKAGGAYLPLDPQYPKARLAFALADSQARVLVTENKLLDRLPTHSARVVCLDRLPTHGSRSSGAECAEAAPADGLRARVRPENLAYVIYTSGSTGQPKGVCIEHRNVAALLAWAQSTYRPEELQGVLASTSLCFDLSVFEIFVPLSCGQRVILAENLLHLPTLAAAHEVTLINTVPSAMAELVRLGAVPSSVRTVNLAGEPLRKELVREVYENTAVERVFDLYGPTEDTVYSTGALRRVDGPLTIGRPLHEKQSYILDGDQRLAPVGVPGELYLGGAGLSRGYWNRPDWTAERFIPNPFGAEAGSRLYRTGDLARHLADGNIQFLGRKDHQVKLRGYRIELGEIEATLRGCSGVKEALVVVRENGGRDRSLVGYVVAELNQSLEREQLRRSLAERLPGYMVPSGWVFLEKLPQAPNGKVDRGALPGLEVANGKEAPSGARPLSATERVLAQIWGSVLEREPVGVEENFFELGGHSLLVTRVLARVRAAFELEVPLRILFDAPTIASFAAAIDKMLLEEMRECRLEEVEQR